MKRWSLDARSGDYASLLAENVYMGTSNRRPHVDQPDALPREGRQASLEGSLKWMTVPRCAQ
jgi:hypothetical protein